MGSRATSERWFFYQDASDLWKWARLDLMGTVLDHSGAAFATREECVDQARRCGYRGERPCPEDLPVQDPLLLNGRRTTALATY